MNDKSYKVVDTFVIEGRGLVVIIDGLTELNVGNPHKVEVQTKTGETFTSESYKEWLCIRHPKPIEKEAYLLKDLQKEQVPIGSKITFRSN